MGVVNTHALNQILVVPLRPRLTLHAVVHLLLQSVVISGDHFDAVLIPLTVQLELVYQVLLSARHSLLFSDALGVLLVLRLDPLEILGLILGPLQLLREVFQLLSELRLGPVQARFQIVYFLTISISLTLIKLLELLDILSGIIILLGLGRGCD